MEQLPKLSARLATLSDLRDIVRAMRAMAAGATREGEAALLPVRRYSEIMEAAVADALALAREDRPDVRPAPSEGRERLLCLIGTEHGFVGNLNARLVAEAAEPRDGQTILVVGRRAASVADELGIPVAKAIPMTAHVRAIPTLARAVTEHMAAAETVRVAFCRHRPESGLTIVRRQIVPILEEENARPSPNPPLHHLQPMALLNGFVEQYLIAEVARALTEAFVGENATRLRVLTAADRNVGDKMDELQRMAQQLRQETITSELLDIVIGAGAVSDAGA